MRLPRRQDFDAWIDNPVKDEEADIQVAPSVRGQCPRELAYIGCACCPEGRALVHRRPTRNVSVSVREQSDCTWCPMLRSVDITAQRMARFGVRQCFPIGPEVHNLGICREVAVFNPPCAVCVEPWRNRSPAEHDDHGTKYDANPALRPRIRLRI